MPVLSSASSEEDIYRLLKTTSEFTWGAARTAELDQAIRSASRNLKVLFSVTLAPRDGEPDYYDNAADGRA